MSGKPETIPNGVPLRSEEPDIAQSAQSGPPDERGQPVAFDRIVSAALSRRRFVAGVVNVGIAAFLTKIGVGDAVAAAAAGKMPASEVLDFEAVAANVFDQVTVPQGYDSYVLASWGDPLWSDGEPFDGKTGGTADSQSRALGDNVDSMESFTVGSRFLLAVNNEYVNRAFLFANRKFKVPDNEDDFRKSQAAVGVSIFEIKRNKADGRWELVKDSRYNRRITAATPMEITGPARGSKHLKTKADPSGTHARGTWANCGTGRTPWGTLLSCEENFNFAFADNGYSDGKKQEICQLDAKLRARMRRYGIEHKAHDRYDPRWRQFDERFDICRHPNESHRVGYVVEIDPSDPSSVPKKRTALGRFKHENAELVVAANGRVVVYMGDDESGEFIYRFVSDKQYVPGAPSNADLLDDGRLYVAQFSNDGRGEWLELTPESTGMSSYAEICVDTRTAASKAGATTMDRPEWVAANPRCPEVYCALANNKDRGVGRNAGGDEMPVGGPNPRAANRYGQIVRWMPENGDHAAPKFKWDLFVLAGNPAVHPNKRNDKHTEAGSDNITADNMFNAPDGVHFDAQCRLWIQTDGDYSNKGDYVGQGNNQMLVGDTKTGEIRRFMVGPKGCEITGLAWSDDGKTMFVGVQHPGDNGKAASHFPDGGRSVPRSSIVAIHKEDGTPISEPTR